MISSLRLQNYRSYRDASFELEPGVNIIVGPNASGKTNLLEAIHVLAQGGSFRGKDADLVKSAKDWARLDGVFGANARVFKLTNAPDRQEKNFVIDDKSYSSIRFELTIPVVLFEPDHLLLITHGPDRRREFFDELLVKTTPGYKKNLNDYRRVLAQRNALLKIGRASASQQLFAWNVRLGELGSQIAAARHDLCRQLNRRLSKVYSQIAKRRSTLGVTYEHQFPVDNYASQMVKKLDQNLDKDLLRGFTAYGPHREDYSFTLNGQPMSVAASRGETRSLLLALKTIELELIEQARQAKPILLLDDVFSELDAVRRRALVETLKDYQVIITTTDADAVLEYFATGTHKLIALK